MSTVTGSKRWRILCQLTGCGKEFYVPNKTTVLILPKCPFQELDKIVEYELKMGGVLLHPTFSGGKEKDKYLKIKF